MSKAPLWVVVAVVAAVAPCAFGQQEEEDSALIAPVPVRQESHRILGLIPNYQTVSDSGGVVKPLSAREKFGLFLRTTTAPFGVSDVAVGAALSHASRGVPDYGSDRGALGRRVAAAYADITSQGALTGAVFPSLLRQDPRYFRMGPGHNVLKRIAYSMSRVAIIRSDEGRQAPNWSFLLGTLTAVGLSNAWYPPGDRNGAVMGTRVMAITLGSATGNLLPEFWPDIQKTVMPRVLPMLLLRFRKGGRGGMSAPAAATGN